ncbi:MAG: TonB-dependent receptor [Bryobacterales bacterium]|nr:TonB-dependent receptor [Bryobacterales bacterium]
MTSYVEMLYTSLVAVCCLATAAFAQTDVRRETVVVTGVFDPVSPEEADRSVLVLPVREWNLLSNTLADFLKLDPSVDLRQRAPNGLQSDLSIRGGTFGQTLVLIDGQRVNDAQSGHHNMNIPLPMEMIDRIEILRGAGSTYYGSDAVGGVLNVITRQPEAAEFRLRTAVGNFGVNQQRGVIGFAAGPLVQHLSFNRDFSTGFIPNRDYRNLSLASRTHLTTGLGNTGITLAHNDRPFGAEQFYGNFNSWERTKTWLASARQELGERTSVSFTFRRHTDLFVLFRDRPQVFTNRHAADSYLGALRRREPVGTNATLHWGVEGLGESIDSNNLGQHSRRRGAAYATYDVRALRRFSFSVGAREEVFGARSHQFSPNAAVGVWIAPQLKLRGGVSRAFRIPTYTDLYYHDPANRGSPDLRPESAWNYEAGANWNGAGRVRGDLTVFHRRETDGIDYVRTSLTDLWRATNISRLRFTGVEAGITALPARRQHLDIRYTGLRGVQDAVPGIFSRYVFNYPVHSGVVSWQGAGPGGLLVRTRLGALQRLARDPYAVWDLYLASDRPRFRPFVQWTNLTATRYQEILGVAMPGRAIVAGLEIAVLPERRP